MRGLSVVAASGGHSSSRCVGLSLLRPLLLRSTGSRRAGSAVVAHGPSCSAACGIFPDQGTNPCSLHWQADSQPLRPQGSPTLNLNRYMWQVATILDSTILELERPLSLYILLSPQKPLKRLFNKLTFSEPITERQKATSSVLAVLLIVKRKRKKKILLLGRHLTV